MPDWAVANARGGFDQLLQLRNQFGFRIVVSRLGVIEESLALVRNYPLDIVQLDPALIKGVEKDSERRLYLQSIVQLSHSMGAGVIAAGAEHMTEWDSLSDIDIDGVMGFLVGQLGLLLTDDHLA